MQPVTAPPALGWSPFFEETFCELAEPGWRPGRVNSALRDIWRVIHNDGEVQTSVSGRLRYELKKGALRPVVGDWVAVEVHDDGSAVIHKVLPRNNCLSRRDTGTGDEKVRDQVIVANVDVALVVCGLDRDFNPRRIERYVTLAYSNGMQPVVVLTKADLCSDVSGRLEEVRAVTPGVSIGAIDSISGTGVDWVSTQIPKDQTACFMGSSGAGKSTLINRLLGSERQRTQAVSTVTGKGLHTTTHRELFLLPEGGIVIDNPGVREINLSEDEKGLTDSFVDIDTLGKGCHFRDCHHNSEPGCAVRAAVKAGNLPAERLASYRRLKGD